MDEEHSRKKTWTADTGKWKGTGITGDRQSDVTTEDAYQSVMAKTNSSTGN